MESIVRNRKGKKREKEKKKHTYVRHIAQLLAMQDLTHSLILGLRRVLRRRMALANRPGDNGDVELTRKSLVARQELFRLGTAQDEVLVLGHPGGEVVLWEDGNVAAGGGGFANGSLCRGKVCGWVDGLRRDKRGQRMLGCESDDDDDVDMD